MFSKRKKPKARSNRVVKASRPSRLSLWWRGQSHQRRRALTRSIVWVVAGAAISLTVVLGMRRMERKVLSLRRPGPTSVDLKLLATPSWMPASLQRHIAAALVPAPEQSDDAHLSEKVYQRALAHPWIREVRIVRRRPGEHRNTVTLEVEATFRRPIARIVAGGATAYVDADGVRLPSDGVPRWVARVGRRGGRRRQVCFLHRGQVPSGVRVKPVHYILIDGAAQPAPPVGQPWRGQDVASALKLVRLLARRPYTNQITVVDIRNHAGRISPTKAHLRMYAQLRRGGATDIYFGRFPRPGGDFVVSPARKLSYLDEYVARHRGRLAGLNAYLDLRYDELHVSVY